MIFRKIWGPSVDSFLGGLLGIFGGRRKSGPASLGIFLEGPVFQIYCKNKYKTLIFKTSSLRHLGSLGSLSEAISVHFGLVFRTQNNPKTAPELI